MKFNSYHSKEKGSALILVLMMVILLSIIVAEVALSAQTSFQIAENHLLQLKMSETAEFGFSLAEGRIEKGFIKESLKEAEQNNDEEEEIEDNIFTQYSIEKDGDLSIEEDEEELDPRKTEFIFPYTSETQKYNDLAMEYRIDLEERKINLNRLVDGSKVNERLKSATLKIFQLFKGTEEDLAKIIDYIDEDENGEHEENAINRNASTWDELLAIEDIELEFLMDEEGLNQYESGVTQEGTSSESLDFEEDSELGLKRTLDDFFTFHSTGKINVNEADKIILEGIFTKKTELTFLQKILKKRKTGEYTNLKQIAVKAKEKKDFKEIQNMLTVDRKTFSVNVYIKPIESNATKVFYGYYMWDKSIKKVQFLSRTERFASERVARDELELSEEKEEMFKNFSLDEPLAE